MRMFAQDAAFHRRIRVDATDDAEARCRLSLLEGIDAMRERFTAAEAWPGVRGVAGDVLRVAQAASRTARRRVWFRAAAARAAIGVGGGRGRTGTRGCRRAT